MRLWLSLRKTFTISTMDREFPTYVVLGDNINFMGESLSAAIAHKFYLKLQRLNWPIEDAMLCQRGALEPNKVKRKIIVCVVINR